MASANNQPTITEFVDKIEVQLEEIFVGKVPAIPENGKELIVKISPWLAVISIILTAPLILGALGLSAIFLPVSIIGGFGMGFQTIVSLIFSVVLIILNIMAIPGLFKRAAKSWKIMFYIMLLNAIQNILILNLVGLVVGVTISSYILFQVKAKYQN